MVAGLVIFVARVLLDMAWKIVVAAMVIFSTLWVVTVLLT